MFVTYKKFKVDGYTKVEKSGLTKGGGWLEGPEGGGYYENVCGVKCLWDPGKNPKDNRATLAANYTISSGYCASSRSESCSRQGLCSLDTGIGTGADVNMFAYMTDTSSSALFAKLTCVDGFTSTQSESENPYTETAKLVCTTSENSGKDIASAGAFPTDTTDCFYVTHSGAISLYAGGRNFPVELDSSKTTTWCGARDGDGACVSTDTCSGCTRAAITYYDGCGNPDAGADGPNNISILQVYKTKDPCPIYTYSDCESVYILSKAGSYIAGGKNVGSFSTITVHALSANKAIEFNISTGKEKPYITQTFSYKNDEVTLKKLEAKKSAYSNSYIWIGESDVYTSTYTTDVGGYEAGSAATLFYSEEVKATATGVAWETTGPGSHPCCRPFPIWTDDCTSKEVSKSTTDTISAGKSFEFTHVKMSTTMLGEYYAYQPTTISRGDHLAWGEFGYSTSGGGVYKSSYNNQEEHECESVVVSEVLTSVGDDPFEKCYDCFPGMVTVGYMKPNEIPGTAKCGDLFCGCTSAEGGSMEGPPYPPLVEAQTECYHTCASAKACGDPETGCCMDHGPKYYSEYRRTDVSKNMISRTGDCGLADQYSYDVSYTHLTCVQTLTTRIGGGFQMTARKFEGLYFLDSTGGMRTATSFILKQSKSDIALSHVNFAFSGAYYNPMGRTTQFGSDGAKKTFIALATANATYIVGSPDGKSKSTGSQTASHDGDLHSYYISDPDVNNKAWNQASWPGHGVVRGKITTGTFSFSFRTGFFANSYGGGGSVARFSPGAKQTIVADGGLNIISSKAIASETFFDTAYSTNAFSTSFDSNFQGAWLAKAIPYTYVATRSASLNPFFHAGIGADHIIPIDCSGCNFPQPGIPIPLIGDTAAYFIRGDKSLIYNKNAASYLWTHPAYKKQWGTGHGANCEDEE